MQCYAHNWLHYMLREFYQHVQNERAREQIPQLNDDQIALFVDLCSWFDLSADEIIEIIGGEAYARVVLGL